MGFSEVSSSGLTALQIHFEQTRCNFKKVSKERAGRAVAPHQLIKVTDRQSSRTSDSWLGEIPAVGVLSELFANIIIFLHYYAATKSWKSRAASLPLGNLSASLCAQLMQMHQQRPPHSSQPAAAVGAKKHNPIHFRRLSRKKRHKWPLQEINS